MKLSSFKNALSPLVLNDTTELVLSPSFTLHVTRLNGGNRSLAKRNSEFYKTRPDHIGAKDANEFSTALVTKDLTPDVLDYLAHVLVIGWDLKDDEGNDQPFTPSECLDLFNLPNGIGGNVACRVIDTSLSETAFEADWESIVTKNS